MKTAFRWLFYTSAKLGLCSPRPPPSLPPVPKQLSTCQRDPPCPKLSHHSILPQPWDKSNHLFLHLWQTLHLFPSTYPSVHTSIVLCPCVCLSFALWALPAYMCHSPCPIPLCHSGPCDREGSSDTAKSYLLGFVFTCALGEIHVRHLCIVHSHQHQGLNHLAIREMWQLD